MQVGEERENQGTGRCRYCGEEIWWFLSRNEKFYPCSSDDYQDFHNCGEGEEARARNRRARQTRENSANGGGWKTKVPESVAPGDIGAMMNNVVLAGYRNLAAKLHPDHGGTNEEMTTLNLAIERLRKMIL